MTRGRKRKHDPSIPSHIDQKKLPTGIYWNRRDRYWYTLTGKPAVRTRVAEADDLMSDLHKAMEAVRGVRTDTLGYLLGKYHESARFAKLSEASRESYEYSRRALQNYITKVGIPFTDLPLATITMPLIQRLVDQLAEKHPTKANAVKRYLSVAFGWGMRRGFATSNPAKGIEQAAERRAHRMPEEAVMMRVAAFLRSRGSVTSRRRGSLAPYVWAVAEIAYLCRMRGVEVRDLSDASVTEDGLMVVRRKGSLPTLVRWSPDLREAVDWLAERRAKIWAAKSYPIPLRAEDRPLVVQASGAGLQKAAMNSAWRRAMAAAEAEKLITPEQRFGVHGLKHRGVTDTDGSKADKKQASGHRTDAMVQLYDHEVAIVDVAGKRVKKPGK